MSCLDILVATIYLLTKVNWLAAAHRPQFIIQHPFKQTLSSHTVGIDDDKCTTSYGLLICTA